MLLAIVFESRRALYNGVSVELPFDRPLSGRDSRVLQGFLV